MNTLPRKKYRLRNMAVDRVDLVDRGANQYSDIVFFKGMPDTDDVHEKTVPKKKKKKGDPLADAKAVLAKHYGPGNHPDGSPQTVHGGGGTKDWAHVTSPKNKKTWRPRKVKAATRGEAQSIYTRQIGAYGTPNLKVRAYQTDKQGVWIVDAWVEKHYGPGPHSDGSSQEVHGGGRNKMGNSAATRVKPKVLRRGSGEGADKPPASRADTKSFLNERSMQNSRPSSPKNSRPTEASKPLVGAKKLKFEASQRRQNLERAHRQLRDLYDPYGKNNTRRKRIEQYIKDQGGSVRDWGGMGVSLRAPDVSKHYGPGNHPDGSSQDVHGGGGAKGYAQEPSSGHDRELDRRVGLRAKFARGQIKSKGPDGKTYEWRMDVGKRTLYARQQGSSRWTRAAINVPDPDAAIEFIVNDAAMGTGHHEVLEKSTPGRARALRALAAAKKRNKRRMAEGKNPIVEGKEVSPSSLGKHYGPGPHSDGSSQDVHGGGGTTTGRAHMGRRSEKVTETTTSGKRKTMHLSRAAMQSKYPDSRFKEITVTSSKGKLYFDGNYGDGSGTTRTFNDWAEMREFIRRPSKMKKHAGPGPHPSGSSQEVHGGDGGGNGGGGNPYKEGEPKTMDEARRSGQRMAEYDASTTPSGHRPLRVIAREVVADWSPKGKGVNYAAKPYLRAMLELDDITDMYGMDSADSVVAYFLSNARSWTGPKAKEVKAELKEMLKIRKSANLDSVLKAFTDALIEADVFIEDATPEELRDMLSDKALANIGKSLLSAESADAIEENNMAIDIEALDLPDEAVEYIDELEETVAELTKALEVAIDDDEDEDEDELEDLAKRIEAFDPEVAAVFKAARDRVAELEAAAIIHDAELRKQAEDTADREYIAKAATYAHVVGSPEEFGPDLRRVAEFDPGIAERLEKVLEQASARLAKSKLLEEVGTGIPSETVGAFEKATAIAKSMVSDGTAENIEAARAQVWTMNPELFDEYREELNSRA